MGSGPVKVLLGFFEAMCDPTECGYRLVKVSTPTDAHRLGLDDSAVGAYAVEPKKRRFKPTKMYQKVRVVYKGQSFTVEAIRGTDGYLYCYHDELERR